MKPLYGDKTHPLTDHARMMLGRLCGSGPIPRQEFNPGVANRLLRGELATQVMRPSPYKTHKGRPLAHLEITAAGRALLDIPVEVKRRRLPWNLRANLAAHAKRQLR